MGCPTGQAKTVDQLLRADVWVGHAGHRHGGCQDVLLDVEIRDQMKLLKHVSDMLAAEDGAGLRTELVQIRTLDLDGSAIRLE